MRDVARRSGPTALRATIPFPRVFAIAGTWVFCNAQMGARELQSHC